MKSNIYHPVVKFGPQLVTNITPDGQCDCDCDCACAPMSVVSFAETSSSALWQKADNICSSPISLEYTAFLSPLKSGVVVLSSNACQVLTSFTSPLSLDNAALHTNTHAPRKIDTAHQLAALGLLVPAGEDCTRVTSMDTCSTVESSNPLLVAWLHLTDRCNLRCSYCYLPHVREDMTPEIGCTAIDATFRSATANGFKQVKLKYAGGEPLLRFPLIVKLHHYARSLAEENELSLDGVVLSNGTLLTTEMIKTLKLLGLRLMISLDGLGRYHDAHRPYIDGRGSFSDVKTAVDLALANGFIPNISITVSNKTADGLPEIIQWVLERELPFSLNFYRGNEFSVSYEDMCLDDEKIIKGMLAAFKVVENNLPKREFLGGVIDRANLSTTHMHTCGVGQNYLVFNQSGQIAKCQMQIRKPVTGLQAQDPLAVIRSEGNGIQNISVEEKESCRTCEWKYWCAGGCPLATYWATGRYDVKSPNCNVYKALFPEALRLEGLRLLKYQDDPEVVVRYV